MHLITDPYVIIVYGSCLQILGTVCRPHPKQVTWRYWIAYDICVYAWVCSAVVPQGVGLGSVGLGSVELGWVGLSWVEFGWVGFGWVELG